MKVCPECGTQYEDHVPTCIADGTELQPAAQSVPTQILPARPAAPVPAAPPPPAGPRLSVLLVVGLASGVVALLLVGVIVASQLAVSRPSAPEPPPRPVHVAPPAPPERHEAPPVEVVLVSEPLGAKVYENDQFVCETPCAVQHPPHAPLPRTFVFKAAGHRDETFEMTEAKGPITVQLSRLRSASSPAGPSSAVPRPTIGRDR